MFFLSKGKRTSLIGGERPPRSVAPPSLVVLHRGTELISRLLIHRASSPAGGGWNVVIVRREERSEKGFSVKGKSLHCHFTVGLHLPHDMAMGQHFFVP